MKYRALVKHIRTYIPHGQQKWNQNVGLDKFRYLMELLGNPQDRLQFVHIGGTSGKGSTATFMASILKESGYKTGLHLSPDVISVRERAQINGKKISKKRFRQIFENIEPCFRLVEEKYNCLPSYYEILLAIAFIYFAEERCDLVVLEVGLGGKLDGTNIVKCQYQIITNIGLDHTKILGSTKELILTDKKEIIKNNSIVVSGIAEEELLKILRTKVSETCSSLYLYGQDFNSENVLVDNSQESNLKTSFDFTLDKEILKNINIKMPGKFQIGNASLAVAMALCLKKTFSKINNMAIKTGVENAWAPGRFQIFSQNPPGIIDGAHNPDKIKALVDSIKAYYPDHKFIVLFRFKKRSDITQSLDSLKSIAHKIIITGSHKSGDLGWDLLYGPEDEVSLKGSLYSVELDLRRAYEMARNECQKQDNLGILVTGSLYMIGEFMENLKREKVSEVISGEL